MTFLAALVGILVVIFGIVFMIAKIVRILFLIVVGLFIACVLGCFYVSVLAGLSAMAVVLEWTGGDHPGLIFLAGLTVFAGMFCLCVWGLTSELKKKYKAMKDRQAVQS